MTRIKLFFVLLFCAFFGNAFAQDCPKIYRSGDTLKTDPAGGYQWFLNGNIIPNATKQWHLGTVKGDYTVEVSGASPVFTVDNQVKSIFGRIIDERYEPLADAKITVGGKNVLSDAQGLFSLKDLDIKGTTAVLTIEKAGFWKNTQRITFFDGKEANLTAMLEPLRVTNRFDAQKGATISERGFFLTFPPNSAVNEKGEIYTGTINLSLKRAFPSEEGFGYRMPGGDFSAIDANGQEKILISYGFMSAEMQGANGEKLNLATDKEATLEFYIPWEQNKTAPESMPLWHFDEISGMWFPEGTARKVGPRYMGTVKHFSSWNCDYPEDRATVKGRVIDCKGNPIPGGRVEIGQVYAITDSTGRYERFVPAGIEFKVTASVDTIIVTSLTEGEERTLQDLKANYTGYTVGLIDSSGILTVYGYGVKEYSIDSGKTFQPKNQKLTFKDNYPTKGVTRDSSDCEANFRIHVIPKQGDCQLLDSAALESEMSYSFNYALSVKGNVYKLIIRDSFDFQRIISTFPCVQSITNYQVQMVSLPDNIGELSNLQMLYCVLNQMNNLPESIGQLLNLKYLSIASNQLTVLPESIGQLGNLQILESQDNQLTVLPESIGQLGNLQQLNIYKNQLTSVPESIGRLSNLQMLSSSTNQLMSLPESIGQLTNLQELDLSYNQLNSLPPTIGQLSNLQRLNLSTNQLMSLPESIGQLTNLQELNLWGNQLGSVPESIGQLTNLQDMYLHQNQLESLPASIANLKDNLKTLSLYDNNFSEEEKAKIQSWLPNTTIFW